MKRKLALSILLSIAAASGCGKDAAVNTYNAPAKAFPDPASTASPRPAASQPPASKDGDYDAKGVVTKIDLKLGSVGLDHEDIPGLMPPMSMEFYVSDKKLLDGLKVGDKVDFVLRYKAHTETVVEIKKAK